ncbi:MAG: outer membrane lipoprotein-sorting protein [Gammaproteobacteria bacterium]|nr:outer membrane lipoprotein-sorting protein [Gammaproteobacteria bacterium]
MSVIRYATVLMMMLIASGVIAESMAPAADNISGEEVFRKCGYKYPGKDQVSRFTVLLRNDDGQVKKSEYIRVWKDFDGIDQIADKMLLFTIYPPDAKGASFMRVAYTKEQQYKVDQWIYLPVLKKIRRVTVRDPGDSFLNSNLTYADVAMRALEDDTHKLLGVKKVKDLEFYVVESIPRETKPLYSKRVFWFEKTVDWKDCSNVRIDYYDTKGELQKEQFIKWQRVGDAWIWDRVLVRNRQNQSASVFELSGVRINTGIREDVFSERSLVQGLKLEGGGEDSPASREDGKKGEGTGDVPAAAVTNNVLDGSAEGAARK